MKKRKNTKSYRASVTKKSAISSNDWDLQPTIDHYWHQSWQVVVDAVMYLPIDEGCVVEQWSGCVEALAEGGSRIHTEGQWHPHTHTRSSTQHQY